MREAKLSLNELPGRSKWMLEVSENGEPLEFGVSWHRTVAGAKQFAREFHGVEVG